MFNRSVVLTVILIALGLPLGALLPYFLFFDERQRSFGDKEGDTTYEVSTLYVDESRPIQSSVSGDPTIKQQATWIMAIDKQMKDIIDSTLIYNPVGEVFSEDSSPCENKDGPRKNYSTDRYECDKDFSDQIRIYEENNNNNDSPSIHQSFNFLEDGTLNSVLIGLHNTFPNLEVAEDFINDTYGHLGLREVFSTDNWYSPNGEIINTFRFDRPPNGPVSSWSRKQFSFGCDLYPSSINPGNRIKPGSPGYGEWEPILGEVFRAYSWMGRRPLSLAAAVDFHVNPKSVMRNISDKCVLATIIYGEVKRTSLTRPPGRPIVQVIIADINPRFPITRR